MVYRAALYLRVSKEDTKKAEQNGQELQNSIENQRRFLLEYLKDQTEIEVYDCYIDRGYSGLLFEERPGFLRMWKDILERTVNMVVVKDLSRFGREHIQTDAYIRKIFPSLGVRFLAVADSYDSLFAKEEEQNLLIPIKNFINDSYARDISIKIRSSQEAMRREGICAGAFVPYGYRKEQGRLCPEAESAVVVKLIYLLKLEGKSAGHIAEKLNQWGISSPAEFRRERGSVYYTGFQEYETAKWTGTSVDRILKNRVYIGVLEQGKWKRISYKVQTVIAVPEEKWSRTEGAHPAIISEEAYQLVQKISGLDMRQAPRQNSLDRLSGLLFCGDCKRAMVRRSGHAKRKREDYYICSGYNKGEGCSRHSILADRLFQIVWSVIACSSKGMEQMQKLREKRGRNIWDIFIQNSEKKIEKYKKRLEQAEEDFNRGILNTEEYQRYRTVYLEGQKKQRQAVFLCKQEKSRREEEDKQGREWKEIVPDRLLCLLLIEKIEIGEEKKIKIWVRFRMDR